MKRGGLGILEPWLLVERVHNTSKAASEVLVGSLLGGTDLNYVLHKGCIHRASVVRRNQRNISENAALTRRKNLVDRAGMNHLQWATEIWQWITATPHSLNGPELLWEEFKENLILLYGIVPLNLLVYYDGCGKKLLVRNDLSFPKGGLVLVHNNDAVKNWGALLAQTINLSAISYEPIINIRTVQGPEHL